MATTTVTTANPDKQPDREFARKLLQSSTGKEKGTDYEVRLGEKKETRKQSTRRFTW